MSVYDATCAELATWIRGHWGIENLLHHVRDRTLREDNSNVRTGTLPRARKRPPCPTGDPESRSP